MIWYLDNLFRHRSEREALESLASVSEWLEPIGWCIDTSLRLVWDADILVNGRTFSISVRYPNHFPHSPPTVLPRGNSERWSAHQYGSGGELCLEYGPDNWRPELTGAEMIQSAYRLLEGEHSEPDAPTEVASRHRTTTGQELRGEFSRLLVTRPFLDCTATLPEGVVCVAKCISQLHSESFVTFVVSMTLPDGTAWTDSLPPSFKLEHERSMAIFRWSESTPLPDCGSQEEFRESVVREQITIPDVSHVLLLRGDGIHAYWFSSCDSSVYTLTTIFPPPRVPRLDKDHEVLSTKHVGIVGCGSLGSKVAVTLARCGVGKFFLVDDDVLFPDNLVRHDLDWREVGTHKADSVATRIALANPAASCKKRKHRLGGQESSGSVESLIEGFADCDLLIDATADPSAFNYLCAAVEFAKKPLMWAEVFGGGIGGLIARHRPGLEPSPANMRYLIDKWCADQGKPVAPRSLMAYEGEGDATQIADDADVSAIAAHASRMAVDLLVGRSPSIFPNSVYLIGLSEGWLFDRPFETYPIDVVPPPESTGEDTELDKEASAEELARIRQLFEEFKNAAGSPQKNSETA